MRRYDGPRRTAGQSAARFGWRMRILIIEDELVIAIHVETSLSEEGHQVVGIAREAEAALGLAQRLRPDLALVDVHLVDGESGPERSSPRAAGNSGWVC